MCDLLISKKLLSDWNETFLMSWRFVSSWLRLTEAYRLPKYVSMRLSSPA